MLRRIQSQADGVKRQFLLDRVGKSTTRALEHEFDRVRVDRMGTSSLSDAAGQRGSGCMSFETSSLLWLRGQRCAAHGGEQRLFSEARASLCPRRHVFSVLGTASNFAAPGEHDRK